jgi:hypothetical protein
MSHWPLTGPGSNDSRPLYKQHPYTEAEATNTRQLYCFASAHGWFFSTSPIIGKGGHPEEPVRGFCYLQYTSKSKKTVLLDCVTAPCNVHWPQWAGSPREEIVIQRFDGCKDDEDLGADEDLDRKGADALYRGLSETTDCGIKGKLAAQYFGFLDSELGITGDRALAVTLLYLSKQTCSDRLKNLADVALRDRPEDYADAVESFPRCHRASTEHRAPRT